jgi:hypothetical protein
LGTPRPEKRFVSLQTSGTTHHRAVTTNPRQGTGNLSLRLVQNIGQAKIIGTVPIIPGRRSRKRPIRHDHRRYCDHWRIEAAFCRLKDFRRVATRYDKLAINFLSAVVLAAIIAFWV